MWFAAIWAAVNLWSQFSGIGREYTLENYNMAIIVSSKRKFTNIWNTLDTLA